MTLYSLGLGQMTLKSALDQPFLAEIELIDVGGMALTDIKVSLASPESFEQVGIPLEAAVYQLNFVVEKNKAGKAIVKVTSTEHILDPYIPLLIDLTWPKGQSYKEYQVLLDPIGYHLGGVRIHGKRRHYLHVTHQHGQPGVHDQTITTAVNRYSMDTVDVNTAKKATAYGPSAPSDSVWQIAQRYKTANLILPQVVLAIVGTNPDAFQKGNLNGLKAGVRLTIPSTKDMMMVPADLATTEVMAHDKAWNEKGDIEHVLVPPYITGATTANKNTATSLPSLDSAIAPVPIENLQQIKPSQPPELIKNSTKHAIVNSVVQSQLVALQSKNKKTQELAEKNKAVHSIRHQLSSSGKNQPKQAAPLPNSSSDDLFFSNWPLWALLALLIGGSLCAWRLKKKKQLEEEDVMNATSESESFITKLEPTVDIFEPQAEVLETQAEISEQAFHRAQEPELENKPVTDSEPLPTNRPLSKLIAEQEALGHLEHRNIESQSTNKDLLDTPITESSAQERVTDFEPPEKHDAAIIEEDVKNQAPVKKQARKEKKKNDPLLEENIKSEPNEQSAVSDSKVDEAITFEPGLHKLIEKNPSPPASTPTEDNSSVNAIDYVPTENFKKQDISLEQATPVNPQDSTVKPIDFTQKRKPAKEKKELKIDESLMDFFTEKDDERQEKNENKVGQDDPLNKSIKALDTLLDLAKTYMSMDDFESARHSLHEVEAHGNEAQQEEAKRILNEIKDK